MPAQLARRRLTPPLARTLAVLAATLAAACGGSDQGAPPSTDPVILVSVAPGGRTVTVGHDQPFTATVTIYGGTASPEVAWSVLEGAAAGAVTAGGVFTPASPGGFHVRATSVADPTRFGQAAVTAVAAPVIGLFQGSTTVTAGAPATLYAEFSGGAGVVEPGAVAASSWVPFQVTPAQTTVYTLTVTNAAGDFEQRTFQVEVLPP
jgi:hypothetical protein